MSSNLRQKNEAHNEMKKLQKECADLRKKWNNSLDVNSKLNQENNRALKDWIVQKKQMENLERKNKTLLIKLELSEKEKDALQRSSAKMDQHRIIQIQSLIEQTNDYENKLKELRKKNNEKAAFIRKQAGEIKQLQRMQMMNNDNSQNQTPILITALPPNLEVDETKDISKALYWKQKLDEIDQLKEAKEDYEEKELLHNNRLIVIGKKRTSKEAELKLEDDDRTTKKFK